MYLKQKTYHLKIKYLYNVKLYDGLKETQAKFNYQMNIYSRREQGSHYWADETHYEIQIVVAFIFWIMYTIST